MVVNTAANLSNTVTQYGVEINLNISLYNQPPQYNAPTPTNDLTSGPGGNNGTWDPVTNNRIGTLDPRIQQPATDFINSVESELGIQLRITDAFRTFEQQDALYEQGRTTPGRIVTFARGGESFHNYGLGFDVTEMRNGQFNYNTNWAGISQIGIRIGFEWGGNWKSHPDIPHFQMTFGNTWRQLYQTHYPQLYQTRYK